MSKYLNLSPSLLISPTPVWHASNSTLRVVKANLVEKTCSGVSANLDQVPSLTSWVTLGKSLPLELHLKQLKPWQHRVIALQTVVGEINAWAPVFPPRLVPQLDQPKTCSTYSVALKDTQEQWFWQFVLIHSITFFAGPGKIWKSYQMNVPKASQIQKLLKRLSKTFWSPFINPGVKNPSSRDIFKEKCFHSHIS